MGVKIRGRNLITEIDKECEPRLGQTATIVTGGLDRYSTPTKNLRAANTAASELEGLTGEARQRQQERVNHLLRVACQQNEEMNKAKPDATRSLTGGTFGQE